MGNNVLAFLSSAIEFGVIFLFGCVGEILTEKSGHLNLGIPGIMCVGAAGGCLGVKLCYAVSPEPSAFLVILIAILFAMLFAGALGAVYGFLTVSLRSNQSVTGLACTIFGVGFTAFFLNNAVLTEGVSANLSQAGLNFFNAPPAGRGDDGLVRHPLFGPRHPCVSCHRHRCSRGRRAALHEGGPQPARRG